MGKGKITSTLAVLFFALRISLSAQEMTQVRPDVIRVNSFSDTVMRFMVNTNQIYENGLDTLPQMKFWRQIMNMSPDTGLLSLAMDRRIFCSMTSASWDLLGEAGQENLRDSIRKKNLLSDTASVLFTKGKNDFYNPRSVIPQIDRAIPIFVQQNVDPFFAQAILLIESPGKVVKSGVGANGPFQLMKSVAIQMGLTVNKTVDDRKDFDKSAWAAAKLLRTVCIPYTKAMLDKRGICYEENDLWFRLLVMHVYHAGAGNVEKALVVIHPTEGGIDLIKTLWHTTAGQFGKSSQSYSQVAIAQLLELDVVYGRTEAVHKTYLVNQLYQNPTN